MSDLNLQLVREFFELNLFRVVTNWQQDSWRPRAGDPTTQLVVENTHPVAGATADFVLHPLHLGAIERALVEVRAWHADRFYPSTIETSPVLCQFVNDGSLDFARNLFDGRPCDTILILSELPSTAEQRARAVQLLRDCGIGYVMEFPAILQDMVDKVSVNGNYVGSATLQTLRLLKRYRLIRNQQMEFAFRPEFPAGAAPPVVDLPPEEE